MPTVAVRRFAYQHVRTLERHRGLHQGFVGSAKIAGEMQSLPIDRQRDLGGTQDVAGRNEAGADPGRHSLLLQEGPTLELFQAGHLIILRIQGQGVLMLGVASLLGVTGFLFLQMAAVGQQQLAQIARGLGAKDPSSEALLDQGRQIACVIQVGMGQQHRVDGRGRDRKIRPVALAQLLVTLEQATIDQNPLAGGLDQVARAGHGASGAEEMQGAGRRGRHEGNPCGVRGRPGQAVSGPGAGRSVASPQGWPTLRQAPFVHQRISSTVSLTLGLPVTTWAWA